MDMSGIPSDFYIHVIAGGNFPSTPEKTITIKADGNCTYTYRKTRYVADTTTVHNFTISKDSVEMIYRQFLLSDFFSIVSADSKILDGDKVEIYATINGKTHEVKLINYKNENANSIMGLINSLLPHEYRIDYNALTGIGEI